MTGNVDGADHSSEHSHGRSENPRQEKYPVEWLKDQNSQTYFVYSQIVEAHAAQQNKIGRSVVASAAGLYGLAGGFGVIASFGGRAWELFKDIPKDVKVFLVIFVLVIVVICVASFMSWMKASEPVKLSKLVKEKPLTDYQSANIILDDFDARYRAKSQMRSILTVICAFLISGCVGLILWCIFYVFNFSGLMPYIFSVFLTVVVFAAFIFEDKLIESGWLK